MWLASVQLAASMSLVGLNVVVAKLLAAALPIALLACLRCAIAAVVLWPAMQREGVRPSRIALLNLAMQALFGTALYNAGLLAGLRHTSALEAGLVLATLPAVVAFGAWIFLREPLNARHAFAALLAVAGMAALTLARSTPGHGSGGGSDGGEALLGNLLVFGGVCGEAAYVLLAKKLAGSVPVVTASFWMQCLSALWLLPFAVPGFAAASALLDPRISGLLVFHSLTASLLCLLLWYSGLKRVPAGLAGVFTIFLPASATLSAVLLLGETFTSAHAVGFALMLTSLLIATWPRKTTA